MGGGIRGPGLAVVTFTIRPRCDGLQHGHSRTGLRPRRRPFLWRWGVLEVWRWLGSRMKTQVHTRA